MNDDELFNQACILLVEAHEILGNFFALAKELENDTIKELAS